MTFQPITPILGTIFLAISVGMAYVRWINPRSPSEHALRARWRSGKEASPLGALCQILALASLGIAMIVLGFSTTYAAYAFYVAIPITLIAGLVFVSEN